MGHVHRRRLLLHLMPIFNGYISLLLPATFPAKFPAKFPIPNFHPSNISCILFRAYILV